MSRFRAHPRRFAEPSWGFTVLSLYELYYFYFIFKKLKEENDGEKLGDEKDETTAKQDEKTKEQGQHRRAFSVEEKNRNLEN